MKPDLPPPPRISSTQFCRYIPLLLSDRAEGLRRIAEDCGEIVRIPVPGNPIYLLSSPAFAQRILITNSRNYRKSFDWRIVRDLLGDGLVTSHDDIWRFGRQAALPAFKPRMVESMIPRMISSISGEISAISSSGQSRLPAFGTFSKITLRILVDVLLKVSPPKDTDAIMRAFTDSLEHLDHRLASLIELPSWLPSRSRRRFQRARGVLDFQLDSWIEEKRAQGSGCDDLLSILIAASSRLSEGLNSKVWLRDQLMTFLVAGHETTAVALSWTLWLLCLHPEWQDKLAQEIDEVLGDRAPLVEDLPRFRLTELVIKEGLRLYPPVWSLGREAVNSDELGGYRIPAGSTVVVSPYIIHRRAELWSSPDTFCPERFTDPGVGKCVPFSYFPFSGGARHCIGEDFAMTELKLILVMFLRELSVSIDPKRKVRKSPLISMRPKPDIELEIRKRCARSSRRSPFLRD